MMVIDIQPLHLPEELDLERQPNEKDDLAGISLDNFDKKTVLYDVSLDSVEKCLIAYGPPLLNLKPYLSRMQLYVNGERATYEWEDHPRLKISFLKAELPSASGYDIVFEFPDFSKAVRVENDPPPVGRKVLATVSKNNKVSWVWEWIKFYKKNYNIDDVVIYDNGSDNREELKNALADEAYVVDWDFPYGPTGKTHNTFAQAGALNHCLKRFARKGVLYNFDIDELLICDLTGLEKALGKNGVVYFNSYIVPYVKPKTESYSFEDFVYRRAEIKKTGRKFVCREEAVSVISQHNTWNWLRLPFYSKLRRNKPEKYSVESAYFLHFMGITTNWQPGLNKLKEVTTDGLVKDESHIRMMPVG